MPEKLELKNGQKHDFDVSWKNDKSEVKIQILISGLILSLVID